VLASLTSSVTSFIGSHGLYAIFVLMLLAAVLPTASELVMLYAGALASGAFATAHVTAFGHTIHKPLWAYLAVVATGAVANEIGAVIGWGIGARGGRPFLERHGRWLHVNAEKLSHAEARFEARGAAAVAVGFALPVVRSFVAIPAGIVRVGLRTFVPAAFTGIVVFCSALAAIGWAVGSSYERVHEDFRYVDVAAVVLGAVGLLAYLMLRRRSSTIARRAGTSR
jgi:membrane protein DedA with SNARE-associated domain